MLKAANVCVLSWLIAVSLPGRSLAQQHYLGFPCLIVEDMPLLHARTKQLRQQGVRTFLVYEQGIINTTCGTAGTYLLWLDGREAWSQLVRPTAVYKPVRLPSASLFSYPGILMCGAVKAEDQLKFTPPVVKCEHDFVAYTDSRIAFYFENGDQPLGYAPDPKRQPIRRAFTAQLARELAALATKQQVAQTYKRQPLPPDLQCKYTIFGN